MPTSMSNNLRAPLLAAHSSDPFERRNDRGVREFPLWSCRDIGDITRARLRHWARASRRFRSGRRAAVLARIHRPAPVLCRESVSTSTYQSPMIKSDRGAVRRSRRRLPPWRRDCVARYYCKCPLSPSMRAGSDPTRARRNSTRRSRYRAESGRARPLLPQPREFSELRRGQKAVRPPELAPGLREGFPT